MTVTTTPVFVDLTGRRVKCTRVAVRALTALLLILVAVTVASLIGGVPMPGLTRPVTVPVGETPRPHQELEKTNPDFTVAVVQRADISQPAQIPVEPDNQSPSTATRLDPATSIPASVPQTPAPPRTQTSQSASYGPTTSVPAMAASTPAPTRPTARPTPTNRPVQPPGQSGSDGPGAQHRPSTGHGPQR